MVAKVWAVAGSKVYISANTVANTVDTASEFSALSWTEIKGLNNIGAIGDTSQEIAFDIIDENRVRKQKGTRNGGTMQLVMAHDSTDTGQALLVTAYAAAGEYGFKIEGNDKSTSSGTNSITYFRGLVMSNEKDYGGPNNVVRRNVNVGVNSDLVTVAAT